MKIFIRFPMTKEKTGSRRGPVSSAFPSDTPKSDAAAFRVNEYLQAVPVELARELERENARLHKDLVLRTCERDGARAERNHYMSALPNVQGEPDAQNPRR